jgi:sn-glycerol 3-phosphate transport system substrate-binding protein
MNAVRRAALAMTMVVALAGLAACGGGSSSSDKGSPGTTAASVDELAKQCPLDPLAKATKPVKITYWHAMTRANEDTLKKITTAFNASQHDVQVTLVNQQGYDNNFTKFKTVAGTSDAPDLLQIEDTNLQRMIDSQSIVPAAACVAAAKADISDILPRVVNYYSVAGTLYPVPFNVSNPVFYYNKDAFTKAGLDPNKPPTTFAEIKTDAQALKTAGFKFGFYYKRDSWVLEQFLSLAGEPYVDNGNGRDKRADKVAFDTPYARSILTQLADLVHSGLAGTNPASGPGEIDNLTSICNGNNAMTIDTSAALGTVYQVLGGGGCPAKVTVGVAPLPGSTTKGGVLVGGAANYIVKGSDPAKIAAAWKYAQYLTTPAVQAEWGAGTGYVPISKQAVESATIKQLWAKSPGFTVAYDQLSNGAENSATAGPVIGDYGGVRDAVTNMLEAILITKKDVAAALTAATSTANAAIQSYNDKQS